MIESAAKFNDLVESIPDYLDFNVGEDQKDAFKDALRNAKRVFVTGTGTSFPNALLMEEFINSKGNSTAHFLPTAKMIRKASHLRSDDLVVLISHGMNRADSLIIFENVRKRCPVVLITGNQEFEHVPNAILIYVQPRKEKIFCRPISPITTFKAICQLFDADVPVQKVNTTALESLANWVDQDKQMIILYSADVSFAANLWGIILREGAGLNVSIKDMENYSHGYYGVDTADLKNRQYVILTSSTSADRQDYERAKPLYDIENFNKYVYVVNSKESSLEANMQLFMDGPVLISKLLKRSSFDMNNPNGMQENRRYHEYDHFKNYI